MSILVFSLVIAIVAMALYIFYFVSKLDFKTKEEILKSLRDILIENDFAYDEINTITRHLSISTNKDGTKIAIIKNFNPKNPNYYDYEEIQTRYLDGIEKNSFSAKINYLVDGINHTLTLYPIGNKTKNLVHKIFKNACIKRIEHKHKNLTDILYEASDWECDFVWAYYRQKHIFSYYKTKDHYEVFDINLRKENFTIDTKYNYLEMPIFGVSQQISYFGNYFLDELYKRIFNNIRLLASEIIPNSIYYSVDNDAIYLTNGTSSLQGVVLYKVDEILYKENRISFLMKNQHKTINFMSNAKQIKDLGDFIINYNLKKISLNFDYKSDKLINTTQNTKFVVDFTKNRFIYCANMNKLA